MSSRFDGICRVSTESMEALHGVRYKSYGGHTMLMVKVTSKMLRWGKLYIFCLIRCITDCTTLPLHPHGWITLTLGAFCVAIQLHTLMYSWSRIMQLANTPLLQSTAPGLHLIGIHQTSPLMRGSKHLITTYYSIYRLQKDERLSRPAWLVTYRNKVPPPGVEPRHVTHPSTNRARCE